MTSPTLSPPDPEPPASRVRSWRIFVIPAVLALAGYVVLYALDTRLRTHRGPWEVTFLRDGSGAPAVRIAQPALGVRSVTVRFEGEQVDTNLTLPATVRFDAPLKAVPFGRTAFDDLMYQPGTVVLHCFGHEVQMLPRTLYLNRQPHPWQPEARFDLPPSAKLPSLDPPPKRGPRTPDPAPIRNP